MYFTDECAVCGADIEVTIDDYAGGKTGEPACRKCRDVEMQAEAVDAEVVES